MRKSTHYYILFGIILPAMLFVLANPMGNTSETFAAPLAPGHNIYFQAQGLPDGIAFTIAGLRVNNGGHPTSYTTNFTTPNASATVNADPDSEFTYSGFPVSVTAGGETYFLINVLPASPFIVGLSGGSTAVVATYAVTCTAPAILTEPISQTVVYGEPVSFTVSASGSYPLSYQWYWEGDQIPGANQSIHSIPSVIMDHAGSYQAVVSNNCGYATSSQADLLVNRADQAITFDQPANPVVFGSNFIVSPTASSGLPVDLEVLGSCTSSGYEVTMTSGTGTCTLVASQPGDGNYNPAGDVVHVVEAAKADQAINFPSPASPAVYGSAFTVSLSASSGLPVELVASGGCSNNGTEVTMISGTNACTLTASQPGDDNYNPADQVQNTVAAMKADQSISFTPPSSPASYGASFDLDVFASSGLPVTLDAEGSCTINGFEVTMLSGTGECVLTASQDGNANYNPAGDVTHIVVAAKADQIITFEQPDSPVKYQTSFLVAPVASSDLPVLLSASGSCTSSGYTVTITKTTGICLLTASQTGDQNYQPAEEVQRTVDPAPNGNIILIPLLFGS